MFNQRLFIFFRKLKYCSVKPTFCIALHAVSRIEEKTTQIIVGVTSTCQQLLTKRGSCAQLRSPTERK